MVAKIVDSKLRGSFFHYGRALANHPAPFIALPLVLSALLGYFGGSRLTLGDDLVYLFTPEDGQAKRDGSAMREAGFQPTDLTTSWSAGRVIVKVKDDRENILRSDPVDEILRLDGIIRNAKNTDGETFADLCFRMELGCLESNILRLMTYFRVSHTTQVVNVTYPYYKPFPVGWWSGLYLGNELGGVETARDSTTVLAARAVQLVYHVNATGQRRISMMRAFHRAVADFRSDRVLAFFTSGDSLNDEILTLPGRVMPYLALSGFLLIVFAVGSCTMADCVLTKPWVALVGVVSAGLAMVSSVGLVLLCGQTFHTHVTVVPFLLLGIGVDDMFIMIASWRKTDPRLAVPERTGHALADAATAITITSLTDCVAFAAGTITVFPAVRIFCIYAAVGVAFDYLYQITFFAAILSLAGRREKAGRHWLTCLKVPTNEEASQRSSIYRLCCFGGTPNQDGVSDQHQNDEDRQLPFVSKLLCNYLTPFVVNPFGKLVILFIFIGYLGVGIWGCFYVRVGLEFENLVADDSFVKDFYRAEHRYFKEYGPKVDIVDTGPCEYWKKEVQEAVRNKTSSFDQSSFFKNSSTTAQVWLEDYLTFLNDTGNSNAATEKSLFLYHLNTQFLPTVGRHHKMSIIFSSNFSVIKASRFVVIARNVKTKEQEKDMMLEARRISEHGPLKMSAFTIDFVFSEQIYEIWPSTVQTILIAAAAMFVVSLIFIPHCLSTVLVTFALVSIDAGLAGYMALWGVKLDIVAAVSLIVCIGFSVDFSAHITYAYVSSKAETTGKKMREALQTAGMPIIQSSMSTVLGLLVLAFFPAYLSRSFFKTMFLVMVFGSLHGLFILPVLLTAPCPESCITRRR
ncbi:PREDICTED: patched domain-containing protein 3-like [Branchiostoma belcheri]|uniref:Patched domain-containing protein 3 n=1 Tax=Branchiostoma belcheri TaxID=7741 RepID=A0A6P4Y2R6_BRABE|nr:PREDICTED: patched domain-containing protein 3-like [Branchiostoma belcheri]